MIRIQQIGALKNALNKERASNKSIGFVPTMGALHEGHLELIRKAVSENDICICSIFVNPIQFNNKEDLEKYPRDLQSDCDKLQKAGCQMVFIPEVSEMYPEPDLAQFDFGQLDKILEGEFRPGHFNGVAIVVKKLFEIVRPDYAYFGEKDFQQLAIINRLVEMEKIPVQIIPCPTIRENDGLAMSSRNMRLTKKERAIAPQIYRSLISIKQSFNGENAAEIIQKTIQNLSKIEGLKVEYLTIVNNKTLLPFDPQNTIKDDSVALIAAFLGNVRLIDNIKLD
ncbi:MAG: pantoate--beta-alanine ligase [Bacteroidetes bacterium HGW-Bacteroidetes-17]|jgi:pantoate--beta-alanine ligase|nr:MAG: pantoate--beta-alanine ligase [Bacteroidetes bacterium HGW-Bacteroidetes-17]